MSQLDFFADREEQPQRPAGKKRHPVRATLLTLLGLVLVAAVVAGVYVSRLASSFDDKSQTIESAFPEEAERPVKAAGDTSVNILLMGSDEVQDSGQAENTGGADGGRSDTLMLVHVPADRADVSVMSIMRDTWTEIPGHGESKINAAMALGGTPLVVQTVEGLFDTRIDHVANVDFAGFQALTDALGGVQINNPEAFTSSGSRGETFPRGVQTLDGESALKFVRERKALSGGDYNRVRNQQVFVKAVLSKFLTPETLTNPALINQVVEQFSPYISVDSGLDAGTAGSLALGLRNVRTADIHMFTLPTLGTGTSRDGQSIVVKDPKAIADITEALHTDTFAEYAMAVGEGK